MNPWQLAVTEFHRKFGVPVGSRPYIDRSRVALRTRLIAEEARETIDAMAVGDLTETADGLADLIYVAIGAAVEFGIDLEPIFAEVQRSNMTKTADKDAGGKVLKGANFEPPQIARLLLKQQARAETEGR